MARSRVKFEARKLERFAKKVDQLNRVMDDQVAKEIGTYTVEQMRKFIRRGQAPIEGFGRYPEYKESYLQSSQAQKLGKKARPINLTLKGDQLNNLTFKVESARTAGRRVVVGYFDRDSINKELGHATGQNNQAVRPSIPTSGQNFAVLITRGIIRIVNQAIRRLTAEYQKQG